MGQAVRRLAHRESRRAQSPHPVMSLSVVSRRQQCRYVSTRRHNVFSTLPRHSAPASSRRQSVPRRPCSGNRGRAPLLPSIDRSISVRRDSDKAGGASVFTNSRLEQSLSLPVCASKSHARRRAALPWFAYVSAPPPPLPPAQVINHKELEFRMYYHALDPDTKKFTIGENGARRRAPWRLAPSHTAMVHNPSRRPRCSVLGVGRLGASVSFRPDRDAMR